ncbi:MAG: hypothetical protein M1830_009223 [Pleopsidium flavum]|nr:MAG: hypothetical protein M1830_009223 [Pleopsidium flavum]
MPSTRRIKAFGLIMAFFVLLILYFTADARHARSHDFYTSTVKAMDAKAAAAKDAENADVGQRLRDAETVAKKAADAKTPKPASVVAEKEVPIAGGGEDGGRHVAGRIKVKGAAEKWDMGTGKDGQGEVKEVTVETQEEHDVEVELNAILKRSPIIIFSKSYCPFSLKAKRILVEKYSIVPAPFVVELDQHPLGPKLQASLEKTTGRRTVPNVLINGKSIGGGDDVEALDTGGTLVEKVQKMGGKRIMEAKVRGG